MIYDTIIIGGGVTGFATAMYAARLGLKTIIFGGTTGGTIILTDTVENYPGFVKLTGQELADKIKDHALQYPIEVVYDVFVEDIAKNGSYFEINANGSRIQSKTVIFATGAKHRELKVTGHDEFLNKGVHYCALCDAWFYRDKVTAVVGGSDSAAKEALVLAQHSKKVYIIYRGEKIRPEPINMKRIEELEKKGKTEIINKANVVEIRGNDSVSSVILDREYNGSKELKIDGLFVSIGHIPQSELAKKLGVMTNDRRGILIDRESKTNVAGVFAAGDVGDQKFKQAITGVAEGVIASYSAYEYVNKEFVIPT